MRTLLIFLLLACSVILSSIFHMRKAHIEKTDFDYLEESLETMLPYISPTSNIFIDNRTGTFHLPFMSRIILAPAYSTINGIWDTTLIFSEKDTTILSTPDRKIIWQHADSQYQYTLISKQ